MRLAPRLRKRFPDAFVEGEPEHSGDEHRHDGTEGERGHPVAEPVEVPRDVEEVGHHRADGDHLAVGEVREASRAVDQRQPDRTDRNDQAELQTVDRELRNTVGVVVARFALAEGEQRVLVGVGLDLDPLQGILVGVPERVALRERGLDSLDRVDARNSGRSTRQTPSASDTAVPTSLPPASSVR